MYRWSTAIKEQLYSGVHLQSCAVGTTGKMIRFLMGTQMRSMVICAHDGTGKFGGRGKNLGDSWRQHERKTKKKQGSHFQTLKMAKRHHRHHSDVLKSSSTSSPWRDEGATHPQIADVSSISEEKMDGHMFHHNDVVSPGAWYVLYTLRKHGHENYLVGGTVRDFILEQAPKDFDIVTSAEPDLVKKMFPRKSRLLGKRFPIVHVRHKNEIIEVSSFRTNCEDASQIPLDYAALFLEMEHPSPQQDKTRKKKRSRKPQKQNDATWSMARRQNALKRDFTVNGLLYDPFTRVLFDYVGGVRDCRDGIIRTIDTPEKSFTDDPARILRAIRLSSRLHMKIDDDTRNEMKKLRSKVLQLSHGRLQMELHAMFAYGASRAAYTLLEEFDLISGLLPMHHSISTDYCTARDTILTLLASMDKHSNVEHPADAIVWNGVMFSALVFSTIQGRYGMDAWDTRYIGNHQTIDIVDDVANALLSNSLVGRAQLLSRNSIETATHMLKFLLIQRGSAEKEKASYHSFLSSSKGRNTRANKGLAMLEHILHNYPMSCNVPPS